MQHYILRCKHCQREYTFCTYGNGPEYGTEEGCSMEYCAECQKAIDKAFGVIPIKFKPERKEIKEPLLLELFSKIREEEKKKKAEKEKDLSFPLVVCSCSDPDNYDNIETFVHNHKKYQVKWNDKTPDDKHLFVFIEYDILNKKYTDRPWRYDEINSYSFHRNAMKMMTESLAMSSESVPVRPLGRPTGTLFFTDFMWDLNTKKNVIETPKPVHVLETHNLNDTGAGIKARVKYGFHQCKVKVKKGINIKKLIDYVDYKYYYEGYKDEDFVTITKIECV